MLKEILQQRLLAQQNILRQFGIRKAEEDLDLEKARPKVNRVVGDRHPQHPNWVWTEYKPGKFEWRTDPAMKYKRKKQEEPESGGGKTVEQPKQEEPKKEVKQPVEKKEPEKKEEPKKEEKKELSSAEKQKAVKELADDIVKMAGLNRWNNNASYDTAVEAFSKFIGEMKKTDGFAAKVAETIDKTIANSGGNVASISSKQAWALANAAVENGISLYGKEVEKKVSEKEEWEKKRKEFKKKQAEANKSANAAKQLISDSLKPHNISEDEAGTPVERKDASGNTVKLQKYVGEGVQVDGKTLDYELRESWRDDKSALKVWQPYLDGKPVGKGEHTKNRGLDSLKELVMEKYGEQLKEVISKPASRKKKK